MLGKATVFVRFEVPAGAHILGVAEALVEYSNLVNISVVASFNDVDIEANPGETAESICQRWHEKREAGIAQGKKIRGETL